MVKNKAQVNAQNEHGNSPLHYACFNNHAEVSQYLGTFALLSECSLSAFRKSSILVQNGALVSLCNKYNQTPIDKARPELSRRLIDLAGKLDQDLEKIPYQTQLWPVGQTKPNTMRLHDKHNDLDMKVCNLCNPNIAL